jgi:hypothetical protein
MKKKTKNHGIQLQEGITNVERIVFDDHVLYKNKVDGKDGHEYVIFRPLDCGCEVSVAVHCEDRQDVDALHREMITKMDKMTKEHEKQHENI